MVGEEEGAVYLGMSLTASELKDSRRAGSGGRGRSTSGREEPNSGRWLDGQPRINTVR